MTDEEKICSWIEPKPAVPSRYQHLDKSPDGWWILAPTMGGGMAWYPVSLTFERLHEVEGRLTGEQFDRYERLLMAELEVKHGGILRDCWVQFAIHADLTSKIKALAAVLPERMADHADHERLMERADAALKMLDAVEERIDELRLVLKPFAEMADALIAQDWWTPTKEVMRVGGTALTMADFVQAAVALKGAPK